MAQCSMLSAGQSTFSPAGKLDAHSLVDKLGKVDGTLLRVGHLVGGISRSPSHFDREMASHVFPHIICGFTTRRLARRTAASEYARRSTPCAFCACQDAK